MSDATTDSPHEGSIGFSCADEVAKRIALLYGDERLADVTFVVSRGEGPERSFIGHRNIISTWSKPLERMLCGSFAERSSPEVHIRDVEPSAFEAMLKLMYCGTAEITEENVLAVLDVSVRFDVAPLVQFCVQFLQHHTSSEHACKMLEVGVQYSLTKLMDKCIELMVTDDHILESEDFLKLSSASVLELAKHDSWNLHEDEIFDIMMRWVGANAPSDEDRRSIMHPILEHVRYPHMSVEKLKQLTACTEVPHQLIFDALFFKLHKQEPEELSPLTGRYRSRPGSLLFSWVPTSKVTVSGDLRENARHTSSNGFTGVRGERRMQHGIYSWTVEVAETQSSWIFVGVAQADDPNDVAWRSTGRMLYCLDSRYFHQGSGSNHPCGDRKICSGDCIQVVLDCARHTLAFGIGNEKPVLLFRDLAPVAYVPAVDLRDCGDKVRILSSNPHNRSNSHSYSSPSRNSSAQHQQGGGSGNPPTPHPPDPLSLPGGRSPQHGFHIPSISPSRSSHQRRASETEMENPGGRQPDTGGATASRDASGSGHGRPQLLTERRQHRAMSADLDALRDARYDGAVEDRQVATARGERDRDHHSTHHHQNGDPPLNRSSSPSTTMAFSSPMNPPISRRNTVTSGDVQSDSARHSQATHHMHHVHRDRASDPGLSERPAERSGGGGPSASSYSTGSGHPHGTSSSGSNARTQPRQSQGSQGGAGQSQGYPSERSSCSGVPPPATPPQRGSPRGSPPPPVGSRCSAERDERSAGGAAVGSVGARSTRDSTTREPHDLFSMPPPIGFDAASLPGIAAALSEAQAAEDPPPPVPNPAPPAPAPETL